MYKTLIILISINLYVGCTSLPPPNYTPSSTHIKLVTYNVNWGVSNPRKVSDYLLQSDSDIICLQETNRQWEYWLKKELAELYPYSVFKSSSAAGGIAFMSKYKLHDINYIYPTEGWFPALYAKVHTSIGTIQILNIHLRPPLSDEGKVTISSLYNSSTIHTNEMTYFLGKTNIEKPLVIVGDFNENEGNKAIKKLLKKGFTDALSLYDTSSDTWQWKLLPGIYLKDRYDHVLFNQHLHCTGAKVTHIDASDHMPVFATLITNTKNNKSSHHVNSGLRNK